MIYVASPYSHPDPLVMEERYQQAQQWVGENAPKFAELLYSPIVYWHPIAVLHNLPRDAFYWQQVNEDTMRAASSMILLELPDYQSSVGVNLELVLAEELGLQVKRVDEWS